MLAARLRWGAAQAKGRLGLASLVLSRRVRWEDKTVSATEATE